MFAGEFIHAEPVASDNGPSVLHVTVQSA
jgi:hypothetical protein